MKIITIFLVCIFLFILDIFPTSAVAMATCIAMVLFKVGTVSEVMSGFTSDIFLLIFGTEVFGVAFNESGLSYIVSKFIVNISKNRERRLILIAGIISALLSAFLNNQVVCTLMLIICINIANTIKDINVKNIVLPIVICAILGGQCTLVGAPATLVASSMSENILGYGISMFELLPMGLTILALGMLCIYFISYRQGISIWGKNDQDRVSTEEIQMEIFKPNRKKIIVTLISAVVMILLFITNWTSSGVASTIAGLMCICGGAVEYKSAYSKVNWNVIIWICCSIGIADVFNESGTIQKLCTWLLENVPVDISPVLLLILFVFITVFISNLIANTTAVIMILPFALEFAQQFSLNPQTFLIAVTMGAGLTVMTPLASGFIGMTMRVGYKFKDYVKYGATIQAFLAVAIVISTLVLYPIESI